MKIDDFVAVSGLPGIFKMVANRNNGLIIENLDTGKKKFAASRKHQFTPLASIGIYTDNDTTELKDIFKTMLEQLEKNPPTKNTAPNTEITAYFETILPNYDRDKVFVSDIKKVIKWFTYLNDRDMLSLEDDETEEETNTEEKIETEKKEDSPNVQ